MKNFWKNYRNYFKKIKKQTWINLKKTAEEVFENRPDDILKEILVQFLKDSWKAQTAGMWEFFKKFL